MPKIAISYRRADTDAITGRIFDRLLIHFGRESVFRDIDNIPLGVDFRTHINTVLDKSDIVLVVVGPRWLGGRGTQSRIGNPTDPVRIEVETALRKGTPVIPVLVGRTGMPKVDQLPESLADFAYRNGIRVDPGQDFDLHIVRLIRAMDGMLGTAAASEGPIDSDAIDDPAESEMVSAPAGRPPTDESSDWQSREESNTQIRPVTQPHARFLWVVAGATILIAASAVAVWTVERREQERVREAAVAATAAENAKQEAETKARQEKAAAVDAARQEVEVKARQQQAAAVEAARQEAEMKARQQQTAAVEAARQEAEMKARQQQTAAVEAARQEAEVRAGQQRGTTGVIVKPATPAKRFLGKFDSWAAYTAEDRTGLVCYLVGQPQKSEPAGAARKAPTAMVTHRPVEKIANVVSFVEGYPLKEGSEVALDVGGSKFELFTKDDSAWARTSELDKTIVTALSKAKQAVVKGVPQKSPPTTDIYPLAGFAKALALIDKACGVKR